MLRKDKVRMTLFQVCLSPETNISHKHSLEFQIAEGTAQISSMEYSMSMPNLRIKNEKIRYSTKVINLLPRCYNNT